MKFYLNSTTGNDDHSGLSKDDTEGSTKGPLKTLSALKTKLTQIREENKNLDPIIIEFAEGTYTLNETFSLTDPKYSHITFQAEKDAEVIWRGAKAINGWEEAEINGTKAWVTQIPEVASGDWNFRSLFVNRKRRIRARYPKFDAENKQFETLTIDAIRPEGKDVTTMELHQGDHCFKPKEGDIKDWPTLYDAEAVVLHYWVEERMPNLHFDSESGWLYSSHESHFNLREAFNTTLARYYIDNLFEALTDPGEWYLNKRTGQLFYIPMDGETIENTEIFAPTLAQFIRVNPTLDKYFENSAIEGIHIKGIHFEMADWDSVPTNKMRHDLPPLPKKPYASSAQNTAHLPGSLHFQFARNCSVTQCKISQFGFFGLAAQEGCQDITFSQNEISQAGAGGIKVQGGDGLDPEWSTTQRIQISDNHIHELGRVFHAGPGIVVIHAAHNKVIHNHIHDLFNTGIGCGMIWNYQTNRSHDNLIAFNHIHDCGQKLLNDMGGIYILGVQPGTKVVNNWIHEVNAVDYGAHGIYLDESASHIVVGSNVVHECAGNAFILHKGRDNVVINNIFATEGSPKQCAFEISNEDSNCGLFAMRNIILTKAKNTSVIGGYGLDIFTTKSVFASNLYWNSDEQNSIFANIDFQAKWHHQQGIDLSKWKNLGQDNTSIEENPLISNFGSADMKLEKGSPAINRLGFKPISLSKIGPRDNPSDDDAGEQNFTSTSDMKF